MTANPIRIAITITCNIFALEIGTMKFAGNMFTKVSIMDVVCVGAYVRLDVERVGNAPLNSEAKTSPIEIAIAVVKK